MRRISTWVVVAAAVFLAGRFAVAGENKKPDAEADRQVKELIAKYLALDAKAQAGPEGSKIIEQFKSVRGTPSPSTREAVAQLLAAHNLRQIGAAVHKYEDKAVKPDESYPAYLWQLLPYIEQPALYGGGPPRPKWEYKVSSQDDLKTLGKGDVNAGLNKLGAESWELVSVSDYRFYFKRPTAPPAAFAPYPTPNIRLPKFLTPSLPPEVLPANELRKLELNKEQKEKYDKINQDYQGKRKALPATEDGTSNTILLPSAGEGLLKASLDQVEAMLNQTQRAAFQEMRRRLEGHSLFLPPLPKDSKEREKE